MGTRLEALGPGLTDEGSGLCGAFLRLDRASKERMWDEFKDTGGSW